MDVAMTYCFDDVEIDAEGFRVTKGGGPVRLEPKAIELLLFLAANPTRLVTKAEIQGAVWKNTFVTENALTRLVAQLRKALGDDAKEARYIETVPTRGYRFVAPLRAAPGQRPPEPARRPSLLSIAALVGCLVGIALLVPTLQGWAARGRRAEAGGPGERAVERQVSTTATLNAFPRFSPDGSSVAFATLKQGSMEIVVRPLALGAKEAAITGDGMQNVQPAFSPDGRLLAYHSVGRGGIWLVPALGGVPRQLTTFGSNPAWSPDGAAIAFQSQAWVGTGEGFYPAAEGSTIWLVPARGDGPPRRLTSIEDVGPGGQGSPSWSPDGRRIAFVAGGRVFSVRPDGGGLRRTSRDVWAREVAWENGGRSQLWTGSQAGNWFVWRVPVAPDTGAPTGEREVVASGGEKASAWSQPALSPDGRSAAYVTFRTRRDILEQKLTPDGRADGAPLPIAGSVAGRKVPWGFSPDGRRLAFGTARPGEGQSVWVVDLEKDEARLVLEQADLSWSRAWFPGGRRLGYVAPGARGRSFWSVDVETGEAREHRPLEDHIAWAPALSPDGTSLLAHGARRGGLNVWRMDLRGGPSRALTNDSEGIGWPVWSPAGDKVAVEIMREGHTRIGWMPAAGGPVRELVSTPGQSFPNSFSPDGRRIAFAGQRRGIWNVYWVSLDGGAERRVTSYGSPALYVRYPEWSPRGDRIAFEYAESTSTVWVTELRAER
ncbi:MAG TPA: winged helix-turn-helix domain-containing protein [Vicinamibacteria bacterium]|nr:winged helix-turn-helix domain-containing protein [Vicinamibacteria bacterium]